MKKIAFFIGVVMGIITASQMAHAQSAVALSKDVMDFSYTCISSPSSDIVTSYAKALGQKFLKESPLPDARVRVNLRRLNQANVITDFQEPVTNLISNIVVNEAADTVISGSFTLPLSVREVRTCTEKYSVQVTITGTQDKFTTVTKKLTGTVDVPYPALKVGTISPNYSQSSGTKPY